MRIPEAIQAYASLLQQCFITRNLRKVLQLHCETIKLGLSYDDYIRAKLISCYSSCAQMADAQLIFSFINRKSTFIYNTLIRGYASTKQFNLSISCFHELLISDSNIDKYTLPVVLKSVSAVSSMRLGQQLHTLALVRGFSSELSNCNALITMYSKCGDLGFARKVFDKMPERSQATWCAMMSGYGMHGEFDEVFWLFESMLDFGVFPDAATFTTVLTACSHGGHVEEGKRYFEMMVREFPLSPSLVVDMLGRAGRIEEAKGVIERMEMEPDEALWRAFLGACSIHGRFQIIVRAKQFNLAD